MFAIASIALGIPLVIYGWWRCFHRGDGLALVIVGGLLSYIVPLAIWSAHTSASITG